MGLAATNNDGALLKNLVPLNALSDEQLGPLLSQINITKIKKGGFLFKEGDLEEQNIYLLTGKIALLTDGKEVDAINSGSETARYPLAHQFPRLFSAKAKSAVTCVSIGSRLLSNLLLRSQSESEEAKVEVDNEGGDWMSQLLLSPVFQRIPPANMQQVMMRMEEVTLSAGEVVFKQGDEGDYYYMVSRGRCVVTRQANQGAAPIKLAEIGAGHSFGEEALVSQVPRSCTVTMQSNGLLVRLNKEDFLNLVSEPLSHPLSYENAAEKVGAGAHWLDVRLPEEHEKESLKESINQPTFSLRFQAFDLEIEAEYIVCADTPALAASAAFLLLEKGYIAYHLNEALHKAFEKQNSAVVDATELEESDEEELESNLEEAKENKQRLKQEQVKLRRLEKLYLKTKQSLEIAEQDKNLALEAKEEATKQLELLGTKLDKSENQDTELETMQQARDEMFAELEELKDSIKEMREGHLLREGELKEQITCLQIELDDIDETQQSEFVETQKTVEKINQQLEASEKQHAEQQQAWQEERDQFESDSTALKEQLKTLESGSETSLLKLQQEMELLQQELAVSQQSNVLHEEEYAKLKQSEQALLGKQLEHEKNYTDLQQQLAELNGDVANHSEEKAEQQAEVEKLTLELESVNEKMALESSEQSQQLKQVKGELAQEQEKFSSEQDKQLKKISSLEQQLEEAAIASDELGEEQTQQQEQIAALTQELEEFTELHEANTSELNELVAEKDKQLKQIAALEQQLEEVSTKNDESGDERDQQQGQISALTQELKEFTEQQEANISERNELAAEKDEQLKQIASLELQLEEVTTTSGELREERTQQQEQIEALAQELKELAEQSEAEASTQSEMAVEKEKLNEAINQLKDTHQKTLDKTKAQVETLENELQKRGQLIDEANSQLNREMAEQEERIALLQQELNEAKGTMESVIATNQSEQSEAQSEVTQLRRALDESNASLEQQKEALEAEKLEQSKQTESLKKQISEALNAGSDLDKEREDQHAELLKKIDTLEVRLKTAEDEEEESISAFQETIDELMVRKDDFKSKCEQLQRQLEQLTEERNSQSKMMQKLTSQLDELQANSASTMQQEQLEVTNKTLQKELDAAIGNIKVSQGEVNELRAVIEQHVEEIKLAQSGGGDGEQVEALQRELETVRLQTSHDIKRLRCELELQQSQSVDERDPVQVMAEQQMRQELDSNQQALKDKEVLLNEASRSMRKMEDSLEERDTHADKLQLEIDRLQEMLDEMLQQGVEPLTGEFVDTESDDSSMLKRMFKSKK